jgi:hypothetical protein
MRGAAVEQRGRARQVVEFGHAPVQRQRAGHVFAQGAGDAQEELLRGLDHLARARMAQQVAVVQRAQAEVVEVAIQATSSASLSLRALGCTKPAGGR